MAALIIAIMASTLRLATPLIFASLGGVFTEKSGVVNIALEGIMIMGAFAAIMTMNFIDSPWLGVLVAMIVGILTALINPE